MEGMKPLTLAKPSAAILSLQDELRRGAQLRYGHRLHAVLLVARGLSCRQVARLLGDMPRSVQSWVHRFEAMGVAGLQEGLRRGRPPRLTPQQIAEIQAAFQKPPREFGLRAKQWDGKTLAAHIERAYGVKLGVRQCRRFFHRWALETVKQSAPFNQRVAISDQH